VRWLRPSSEIEPSTVFRNAWSDARVVGALARACQRRASQLFSFFYQRYRTQKGVIMNPRRSATIGQLKPPSGESGDSITPNTAAEYECDERHDDLVAECSVLPAE
jgi:hypothetical protein